MNLDSTRFALLKAIGAPGSFGFLIAGSVGAVLLMVFKRTRRLGRWTLLSLVALYLILSLPVVARAIAGADAAVQAKPVAAYGSVEQMFLMDGDNYKSRAALAARLAAEARPRTLWVLGGNEIKEALVTSGVPQGLVQMAMSSGRTTHDQVSWVHQSMRETRSRRAVIIVSRLQVSRVEALARREHVDIVVIGAPLDNEPPASGIRAWLPSLAGLALSRDALYERAALVYYRQNGWIP